LKLARTLLNTDHALLKQKQATQSGAEEYARCQKSLRAAPNLCNEKDSVIFLMEEQIGLLRDAIQTQGLDFPETQNITLNNVLLILLCLATQYCCVSQHSMASSCGLKRISLFILMMLDAEPHTLTLMLSLININ
jgi:hypothetical protein